MQRQAHQEKQVKWNRIDLPESAVDVSFLNDVEWWESIMQYIMQVSKNNLSWKKLMHVAWMKARGAVWC